MVMIVFVMIMAIVVMVMVVLMLHALHDFFHFDVFPHGFHQVDDLHLRIDGFRQGAFHPFVAFTADKGKDVRGGHLQDVLDRGLVGVQVHTAVEQDGDIHMVIGADDFADPVIDGEDGGDDADFSGFRRGGREAGQQHKKGCSKRKQFFHFQ